MRHGFARVSDWALVDSGSEDGMAFAVFALEPHDLAPERAQAWPHDFLLQLRVSVGGDKLAMALEVSNRGAEAFAFSSALHTYHLVDQAGDVRIDGLREERWRSATCSTRFSTTSTAASTLHAGAATMEMEQDGFTDAVVWNPGAAAAAAMPDLADDEYQRFVCIEPAVIEPVTLSGGEKWIGNYSIKRGQTPVVLLGV